MRVLFRNLLFEFRLLRKLLVLGVSQLLSQVFQVFLRVDLGFHLLFSTVLRLGFRLDFLVFDLQSELPALIFEHNQLFVLIFH